MTEATKTEPRIYIACLAAYNAGRLHGRWIDAAQDTDDLWAAVRKMLAESPIPGAEEWAIHDYEGFGDWHLSEYENLERVALVARLAEEKGAALFAFVANDESVLDDPDELADKFDEAYAGEWDSPEAWAREQVSEIGLPGVGYVWPEHRNLYHPFEERPPWGEVLDNLDSYLDWDAITRAMLEDAWTAKAPDGTVWVFRSY